MPVVSAVSGSLKTSAGFQPFSGTVPVKTSRPVRTPGHQSGLRGRVVAIARHTAPATAASAVLHGALAAAAVAAAGLVLGTRRMRRGT
ncbi:hypothetical protein [Streptomonospora salina]|uniref:hypothetical protein n=1 Tax=Streptomonospora salina TaxID=104205 RepID=UPI0036DC40D9